MIGTTTRAERRVRAVGHAVRCTYCHAPFERRDGPFSCAGCGGLLHEGCWYEAGRCPSLGCAGPDARPPRRRRPPLRPPAPEPTRTPWYVAVALHVVTLGAWLVIGLAFALVAGVWPLLGVVLLGWGLLVAGVRRGWRLDAPWLLVVSGLGAGVALCPLLVLALGWLF